MTTKVPLSLAIAVTPSPVLFGGTVTVQGTLSGTENGNREVVLQANTFPFAAGFQNLGNPELTTASGGFSFPVLGLGLVTQFRVVTVTNPPVASPIAVEAVAVRVESHVRRARRPHHARIFGTVTPAEDGAQVGDPADHARPRRARGRHDAAPPQRDELVVQPCRARAARDLPRARARDQRRAGLELQPADGDQVGPQAQSLLSDRRRSTTDAALRVPLRPAHAPAGGAPHAAPRGSAHVRSRPAVHARPTDIETPSRRPGGATAP